MRIVNTDFHDYYDALLHLYAEEVHPVYKRKRETKEINIDYIDVPKVPYNGQNVIGSNYRDTAPLYGKPEPMIIGFCGEIYPVYKIHRERSFKGYGRDAYSMHYEFVYDAERMIEVEQILRDAEPDLARFWHVIEHKVKDYEEAFKRVKESKQLKSLFEKYKTPIFVLYDFPTHMYFSRETKIIINPNLREYGFMKMVDPYTAIQRLDMFLGNILVEDTALPVVITDDTVKRDAHGFDNMSFKTAKGTKKPRKKRNKG